MATRAPDDQNAWPPRPPREGDPPASAASDEASDVEPGELPPDPAAVGDEAGGTDRLFPCDQCGAELEYRPGLEKLQCPYCGHANAIPQSEAEIEELDFRAYLQQLADAEESEEHTTIRCQACAAEVDQPENTAAFACPFCGTNIDLTARSRRLIKPKALLPFKIESDEAEARFRQWLKKLWFAPNKLKKFARLQQRLRGIYVPYWTYDTKAVTHYSGQRGEDYWVTVGSGKNRRRTRRTRWYPASGVVWNRFDDVLVLASRSLPHKQADALEPWDLTNLAPYDSAYVSGFTAESYQVELDEGFGVAQQKMEPEIVQSIRRDIGGDRQRIHSKRTEYRNLTFKHVLLPVWLSAYRFRDQIYRFLVNARTGEVQGERPWSWVKITLAVLGGLLVLGGFVYVFRDELSGLLG